MKILKRLWFMLIAIVGFLAIINILLPLILWILFRYNMIDHYLSVLEELSDWIK